MVPAVFAIIMLRGRISYIYSGRFVVLLYLDKVENEKVREERSVSDDSTSLVIIFSPNMLDEDPLDVNFNYNLGEECY